MLCMGAGIVSYVVTEVRRKLEKKNKPLEQVVAQGVQRALEIQRGLLPKDLPQLKGRELAGAQQPAQTVGGDYFAVVRFGETRGLTAALLMPNLQAAFRAFAAGARRQRYARRRMRLAQGMGHQERSSRFSTRWWM